MGTAIQTTLGRVDQIVDELLVDLRIDRPPVCALDVADRLGLEVRLNRDQHERGRLVEVSGVTLIVVRPEPRVERYQWTVAHEIGEYLIPRLADRLLGDWGELDAPLREWWANQFATQLLLPTKWFLEDADRLDYDLPALKRIYQSASYEVLAQRLLVAPVPTVVSIFDHGKLTRRLGNTHARPPRLFRVEQSCHQDVMSSGLAMVRTSDEARVQGWPIHEDGWKREILRTELLSLESDPCF